MEDDFHRHMLNNDEFLDMPIDAILYEEHRRCYTLALEKMENGYYIAISFYGGSIVSSYTLISMSEKVDLNYKIIRDFVDNPPEGVHIPDKSKETLHIKTGLTLMNLYGFRESALFFSYN